LRGGADDGAGVVHGANQIGKGFGSEKPLAGEVVGGVDAARFEQFDADVMSQEFQIDRDVAAEVVDRRGKRYSEAAPGLEGRWDGFENAYGCVPSQIGKACPIFDFARVGVGGGVGELVLEGEQFGDEQGVVARSCLESQFLEPQDRDISGDRRSIQKLVESVVDLPFPCIGGESLVGLGVGRGRERAQRHDHRKPHERLPL